MYLYKFDFQSTNIKYLSLENIEKMLGTAVIWTCKETNLFIPPTNIVWGGI
jgi:hypothetical protein